MRLDRRQRRTFVRHEIVGWTAYLHLDSLHGLALAVGHQAAEAWIMLEYVPVLDCVAIGGSPADLYVKGVGAEIIDRRASRARYGLRVIEIVAGLLRVASLSLESIVEMNGHVGKARVVEIDFYRVRCRRALVHRHGRIVCSHGRRRIDRYELAS